MWGRVEIEVNQVVLKRFSSSVKGEYDWNVLWNVAQVLPVICGALLLLRRANRNRDMWAPVLGIAGGAGLVACSSWIFGDTYTGWNFAGVDTFTYVMSVAYLWLFADDLGKRGRWARFFWTVAFLLVCALFGRICFDAADIQGGLFNYLWARNLTGVCCLVVAGLAARLLVSRLARKGRGRLLLLALVLVFVNLCANAVFLVSALEQMRRYRGMSFSNVWMSFFGTGSLRTLCVAVTLAVIMAVPLLSVVYRKRFDDFFGIAAPDEEMKQGS